MIVAILSSFWSSAVLTGNRTRRRRRSTQEQFWSSAVLTGNRTSRLQQWECSRFWSSAVLTGNRTQLIDLVTQLGF